MSILQWIVIRLIEWAIKPLTSLLKSAQSPLESPSGLDKWWVWTALGSQGLPVKASAKSLRDIWMQPEGNWCWWRLGSAVESSGKNERVDLWFIFVVATLPDIAIPIPALHWSGARATDMSVEQTCSETVLRRKRKQKMKLDFQKNVDEKILLHMNTTGHRT